MTPTFQGQIEKGKFTLYNKELFTEYLNSLSGRVVMTVKKLKKGRSNNQNRYYWGVVITILSQELGYTREEMHEALKWKFLRVEKRMLPTTRSTSDLDTKTFEDFLEEVRRWAATDLNIQIPLPNEIEF
jgi:hypothetical protein